MIKVDLITGFLGSGKTTFIRQYAKYLIDSGYKIGILENDYGAVNVDMMLLQDLQCESCDLEMVSGGCDYDCHRRRFKTKLIAMGMCGYDRIIVEPSGIFDVDEFFDVLCEEPLDRWYEKGSVIAVADVMLEEDLSEQSEYLLVSQLANAGKVVLSRTQYASPDKIEVVKERLNRVLKNYGCRRRLDNEVITKSWNSLTNKDFEDIASCGYVSETYIKQQVSRSNSYGSLYFMNVKMSACDLKICAEELMNSRDCGNIFRVKGFIPHNDGWLELNAAHEKVEIKPIKNGQAIIIVIGENLNEDEIAKYFTA